MAGGPRSGSVAALVSVASVLLVCVLGVWAATVGPRDVLGATPRTERSHATPTSPTSRSPSGAPQQQSDIEQDAEKLSPWWALLPLLVSLVAAALFALAASLLLRWLLGRFRERRMPEETEPDSDLSDVDLLALRQRVQDSAEEQRARLADGDPRNAVVRAWLSFEHLTEDLGHGRRAWQTPTEFTLEVMRGTVADHEPLDDLVAVFLRARFSAEPVGEGDRALARDALERIHASLGVTS